MRTMHENTCSRQRIFQEINFLKFILHEVIKDVKCLPHIYVAKKWGLEIFNYFLELMFVICWMLHPEVKFRAKLGDLIKYPWFTRHVDISVYDYDKVLGGKFVHYHSFFHMILKLRLHGAIFRAALHVPETIASCPMDFFQL